MVNYPVSEASDWWSYGVIAFELLTLKVSFNSWINNNFRESVKVSFLNFTFNFIGPGITSYIS